MSAADEQQPDMTLGAAIRQHSLRLGAFAFGAAVLLALVYYGTDERIAEQRLAAEREALAAVMPAALHDNDLLTASFLLDPAASPFADIALLGLSGARPAYLARLQGSSSGVILPLETPEGYSGTITLLIGIAADGVITGVRALEHGETPGLGDKIELRASDWILGFDTRSLANTDEVSWQVKKDGGDFDQFVGATITPRAVVGAVHNALLFFESNREQLLRGSE
jgi:electron transport complex protein RnfG